MGGIIQQVERKANKVNPTIGEPICFNCKHYHGGASYSCDAFKGEIPMDILTDKNRHSKPLEGQANDIVFEPVEE